MLQDTLHLPLDRPIRHRASTMATCRQISTIMETTRQVWPTEQAINRMPTETPTQLDNLHTLNITSTYLRAQNAGDDVNFGP